MYKNIKWQCQKKNLILWHHGLIPASPQKKKKSMHTRVHVVEWCVNFFDSPSSIAEYRFSDGFWCAESVVGFPKTSSAWWSFFFNNYPVWRCEYRKVIFCEWKIEFGHDFNDLWKMRSEPHFWELGETICEFGIFNSHRLIEFIGIFSGLKSVGKNIYTCIYIYSHMMHRLRRSTLPRIRLIRLDLVVGCFFFSLHCYLEYGFSRFVVHSAFSVNLPVKCLQCSLNNQKWAVEFFMKY